MFATPLLDVAIGLSFVYLLLGLICTTVNEMISGWFKTRAEFLEKGILRLLGGDDPAAAAGLKKELYKHPLIRSMTQDMSGLLQKLGKNPGPSYINAQKFSTALFDILSGDKPHTDFAAIQKGGADKGSPALKARFPTLVT